MLEPAFDPETRNYEAIVTAATTSVTVTVDPTSPTAEEITWDSGRPGSPHVRNLGTGTPPQNTITATVKDGTSTRNYTIRVTRTDTPGPPRSLRVTASASNAGEEVTLSWLAPLDDGDAPIDDYQLAIYDEFDFDGFGGEDPTDDELSRINGGWRSVGEDRPHRVTEHADGTTQLYNGRLYYFRVRASNDENGVGNGSNDTSATPAGRPLEPEGFVATPGNARVELTWDLPMDDVAPTDLDHVVGERPIRRNPISSYEYSQDGRWRSIPDSDESTTSHTVTGLRNGTAYHFQVRARNRAGIGEASPQSARVEPGSREPGAPTGLEAQAGDKEVTLSWRAPANSGGEPITGYEYKQEATSGGTDGTWTPTGGPGTTVTVPGLTNGTTYYFKVRAVNDLGCDEPDETDGCGQESLEVSAEPFGKPVTLVTVVTATSDEDRRVPLTWSAVPDPLDELTGFQYRQKAGGGYGSWIDIRNSNESTETHIVRGLTNGTTYTFEVRAVNSSGGGLASEEAEAIPSIPPGAPTLTATAGDAQVELTWTPAADGGRRIIKYECRLRIGAGEYSNPPSCAGKSLGASATSLTLTDDDDVTVVNGEAVGITNDTTYTFQVRAVNDRETTVGARAGNGDWSDEATARPTDGSGTQRTFTISATIDGKSWGRAGVVDATILATVEVNPRYTAPSTSLWVDVRASGFNPSRKVVVFGPTNSSRDVSFTGTTPNSAPTSLSRCWARCWAAPRPSPTPTFPKPWRLPAWRSDPPTPPTRRRGWRRRGATGK